LLPIGRFSSRPEVEFEAVQKAIATNDPAKIASANRIAEWIRVHEASGEVQSSTTLNPTRPLFTEPDPVTKQGIGEQSILAEIAYLKQAGSNTVDPIVISDDGHVALQYFPGSGQIPVLTGNYFLSGLLLGGGITPNDYYRITTAGDGTGFSQRLFDQDQSSRLENGHEYPIIGGETGTFMYSTVGSSFIVIDGKAVIQFAPYEKAGVQDGKWIKVTDASDGGHTDTLFDTANLQPWFTKAFAYDPQDRNTGIDTVNDDGTSTQKALDVDGTKPWSSEATSRDTNGNVRTVEDVFTNGTSAIKYLDTRNTHPYSELDIDEDADGNVTAAKPKIDGQPASNTVDFSVVGQVLGSALGRALAPNNQFGQIAIGTVAGAIGQKLAQAFNASLLTDASKFSLDTAFANFDISLAGAGAGSVASFLTAELGHALGLEGFKEQLFNATIGSVASGVANKVATDMLSKGLSFEAAIAGIDFGSAAINAGYSISGLLGGYLGRELAPAETHTGAVAGQLLGAVGSAIGISAALTGVLGTVLGFIAPGIGSLMGTVLGTLIGDAFAPHPHPAAIDLIDQVGYLYGYTHSQISASDGGDYSIPDPMAAAAVSIVNAYLGAVKGAALDHSMQTQIGYVTDPSFRYIDGWAPTHKYYSFLGPDDAVHRAALDVLQHTEVIGGDILLKRAHANSAASIPDPAPEWAGLITPSSQSGTEKLATLSADLNQAGYFYGHSQYQSSDGGGYEISDRMAQAADDIINAYLHAVDGVALDHSKQATIGYIKNPDLLFVNGISGHTDRSFTSADDAVHFAALDVLQHTEVIGGDLLMKRAHQNSPSNTPEAGPAGGGLPGQSQVSGADQLATLAGDLSIAQDYETYLNNREAINALIAANVSMTGSRYGCGRPLFA
jgi:hypothetical protein